MAKQTLSKKHTQVQHSNGKGIQQEQTEVFDDNLLPDASEIQALHTLDPNILEWLKERAEKEQEFRHSSHTKRNEIIDRNLKGEISTNKLGLTYAFLIIISGMGFFTFLIYLDHLITGTIFSGLTITYAAALFINKRNTEAAKQK